MGLVTSFARPGGNATGINFFDAEVSAKRLALLHELVPKAVRIAVLVNPANASTAEATLRQVPEAARTLGLQVAVPEARTTREIEEAFATLARDRADALFVAADAFFISRRVQFVTLAAGFPRPIPLATKRSRRIDELWGRCSAGVASGRPLHRSNPQGREARRPSRRAVHQIRIRHQPANGQSARH